MLRRWLLRRQEARRLAQADAEALIRDNGASAYSEARERESDEVLASRMRAHWRRVALLVTRMSNADQAAIETPLRD